MNTEYYNEYRQCLSPKGQLYLKADNEGKPDLTFNHHFRRSLVSSCHMYHTLTYTNTYIPHMNHTLCYYLNPIRVSLSHYCTSRSCHCLLACLFAFRFRPRVWNFDLRTVWKTVTLSPCVLSNLNPTRIRNKGKILRSEDLSHLKNMITPFLSLLFDVIFDVNNYTNNVTWFYTNRL